MNFFSRLKLNWYDDRTTRREVNSGEYDFSSEPTRILDLGAHKGFASEYFARRYPQAIIHAYEPNPALYRTLVQRAQKLRNVRTYNEAISDHDGVVQFSISDRNVSSHIADDGEEVPCVSVQTAVDRIGGKVAIKSDIEGAEFDAYKIIPANVVEIVGEVHPEKSGRDSSDLEKDLRARFLDVSVPRSKGIFRAR